LSSIFRVGEALSTVIVVGGRDVGVPVNAEVEIYKVEAGPADPISGEILEMASRWWEKEPSSGWKNTTRWFRSGKGAAFLSTTS